MLNKSGIKKTEYGNPVQILFDVSNQKSVSIIVSASATSQTEDGKKIVKAGTPLFGDLTSRKTAFTSTASDTADVGVLLHDVDVTDGDANGSLLIWGFVNLDRLDGDTKALLTAQKTSLNGKVWLLTDN